MMTTTRADSLTIVALAGVAHNSGAIPAASSPADDLALPGEDAGRDLLLRAGAAAIYRLAGRLPRRDVAALERAPDETRPPCPPEASAFIESLLMTRNHALLPEALARVEQCGYLLPPALLPLALDTVQRETRPALSPLLGERGRWLARFNPAWSWILEQTLPGARDALPPDAETIWQEGTADQRFDLILRLRASDPARAREWLESVWKREKVWARASLLQAFVVGLSPDDEPLLDAALSDRSDDVRVVAADHLSKLPTSALALRLRARADAALSFDGATLDVHPPTEIDTEWARDGLPTQVIPGGSGLRATMLERLLERVPPSHWTERFAVTPETLIAASAHSLWRSTLIAGWSAAAIVFRDDAWIRALWDAWLAMGLSDLNQLEANRLFYCKALAQVAPPDRLEALALRVIADSAAYPGISLQDALRMAPRPWSLAVAHAYFDGLSAFASALAPDARSADPWDSTLDAAALALPESVFAEAREPISVPEPKHWQITQFSKQLEAFAETIRLRERLVKVLPL